MEDGVRSRIMKIQPITKHEPPHKRIEGEAQATEEVSDKYDALIRLGSWDDLPWSWKPVLDVGSQVPRLPQILDVLLSYGGGHH